MHTIIHIGAGRGEELDSYLSSTAEQIVLVEPQPDLAGSLRERIGDNDRVSVVEAAVSPEGAGNQLYRLNLAEASSLYEPTGLRDLFAGLRVEEMLTVDTITPAQLLARYTIPEGRKARLVIEAPGAEVGIIQALLNQKIASFFSEIRVVSSVDPDYSSGRNAPEVIRMLENAGFEKTRIDQSSPDSLFCQFRRNPLQLALEKEKQNQEKLKRELHQLRTRYEKIMSDHMLAKEKIKSLSLRGCNNCSSLERKLSDSSAENSKLKLLLRESAAENEELKSRLILVEKRLNEWREVQDNLSN